MDKMKLRMMAMGKKEKEMPFSKESMEKMYAKKKEGSMEEMMGGMMAPKEGMEEGSESGEYAEMDLGELSPEEKHLIVMFRSKKEEM